MESKIANKILSLAGKLGALQYGEFVLSSGAKSNYYFDGRLISLHPEGSYLLGKAILNAIRGTSITAVGGPAVAAIPIVTAVTLTSHIEEDSVEAFFVRPTAKDHGTERQIEGNLKPGSHVMIIDDVCTSGGSLFIAIDAVENLGCKIEKVMVVLDRKQGGREKIEARGYSLVSILEPDETGVIQVSSGSIG